VVRRIRSQRRFPPAHRADAAGGSIEDGLRASAGEKADAAPRLAVTTPLPETVAALNEFRPEAPTAHRRWRRTAEARG
jgi:hypothetical protein